EADQIAVIEVAEALYFVRRRNGAFEARHDLRLELEAQIHALGANVKKQIARRRDRVARAGVKLAERMQLGRPRRTKEAVPRVGSNPHDAGEVCFNVAKSDGAQQRG